jgi:cellobiose transport system substrate-binding protein
MSIFDNGRAAGAAAAGLVAVSLLLSACGGGGGGTPDAGSPASTLPTPDESKPVTINVDSFGGIFANFEKAGLLDDYKKLHPNVTVKYSEVQQESDYWTALSTKLNSGSGLADIQALEISRAALVTQQQKDKWLDIRSTAVADANKYPPAKQGAITTKDGAVLGFGTDAGPMAICYRNDKLKEAGLPSTSDELAKVITDWDSYEETGRKYVQATKEPWMDSSGGYYRLLTSVQPERNYNADGEPTYETNATVKPSFDRAARVGAEGLTAKLEQFSQPWNTAMNTGDFATIACPAWMLGYIKQQAGDQNAKNWSVLPLPQGLGGNWGGSYLSIPKDSPNAAAAAQLAAFLTSAESETKEFKAGLAFPSNSGSLEQIADVTDPYFNGAPIGKIFSEGFRAAPNQPLGIDDGTIDNTIGKALTSVESNKVAPDAAWQTALKTLEDQIG